MSKWSKAGRITGSDGDLLSVIGILEYLAEKWVSKICWALMLFFHNDLKKRKSMSRGVKRVDKKERTSSRHRWLVPLWNDLSFWPTPALPQP
jgi:hypothetical protein